MTAPGVREASVRAEPFDFAQDKPVEAMTAPGVREASVRAEPFDFAQDKPVEALRAHFDRLSANGYGCIATACS